MSKYRLFFEELFVKKSPIEILKETNNNISMEDILFENFHENKNNSSKATIIINGATIEYSLFK